MKVSILLHDEDNFEIEMTDGDTETQPESESFPSVKIPPVSSSLPPGKTPIFEVTEVVAAPTECLGLDDVTLSVVGQAESLHENQLPVCYQVVTNIPVVGRVYQQQWRGVGGHLVNL